MPADVKLPVKLPILALTLLIFRSPDIVTPIAFARNTPILAFGADKS